MNERALDAIIPANAKIEKLAGGFLFTERPVWVPASENSPGYLLFSDPNNNTIYRWSQDGQVSVFKTKSGYAGVDIGEYNQPGSNGLALDRQNPACHRRWAAPHRVAFYGDWFGLGLTVGRLVRRTVPLRSPS